MTTLSRATAKVFLKSLNEFENLVEMVSRALTPVAPSLVKSHPRNRERLDEVFMTLCFNWKEFKRDLNLSDDDFNKVTDDEPAYEYNDAWMSKLKEEYYELVEKSDEKLHVEKDEVENVPDQKEDKIQLQQEQDIDFYEGLDKMTNIQTKYFY